MSEKDMFEVRTFDRAEYDAANSPIRLMGWSVGYGTKKDQNADGTRSRHYPAGIVQQAVENAGLWQSDLNEMNASKAVTRTKSELKNSKRDCMKLPSTDKNVIVLGVCEAAPDENSAKYDPRGTAYFDKEARTLVDNTENGQFGEQWRMNIVSNSDEDVREFCRKTLVGRCGAVKAELYGSQFFVPIAKYETVQKLIGFMENNGFGRITALPIFDGRSVRQGNVEGLAECIAKKVESVLNAVGKIQKKAGCLPKQQTKLQEAENMIAEYRSLCGDEQTLRNLVESIQSAQKVIADKAIELATA